MPIEDFYGKIRRIYRLNGVLVCTGTSRQGIRLIDTDGYRPNVGIILFNCDRQLFWGRRVGQDAWQFPQGGINTDETPEEAMYRELEEEVGLDSTQVELIGATRGWLRYRLPERYMRRDCFPRCIGQKQVWFLLKACCEEKDFRFDHTGHPEFDHWRWVKYWQPVEEVVYFKRGVYARALRELGPLLFPEGTPPAPRQRQHRRSPYRRCRK